MKDIEKRHITILRLQTDKHKGILSPVGAAYLEELMIKELEDLKEELKKQHSYSIRKKNKHNKAYFFTRVKTDNGFKDVSYVDEYTFYIKLYEHYNGIIVPKKITIRVLCDKYLIDRKNDPSISSQTVAADVTTAHKYIYDTEFEAMNAATIKTYDILRFYKSVTGQGVVTLKAFNKLRTLMNGMFDYGIELGIVESNPARNTPTKRLKFKVAKDNSDDIYTTEDREKLVTYLRELPKQTIYTLAVQLATCFGLRIGELRALTWDDYYPDRHKIYVHHQIVQREINGRRTDVDVPHTKNHLSSGNRWVPVSSEAARLLEELRKINGNRKYILHGSGAAKFAISDNHFNEKLRMYCKNAGIEYHSSHKFRFYAITEMYNAGVDESTIQYLAGHSSSDMTRKYRRSHNTELDEDILEQIFG